MLNDLKKSIIVMFSVMILSGCNSINNELSENWREMDISNIPSYYLEYKGKISEDGKFTVSGFAKDDSAVVALDKAILDAEISAARSLNSNIVNSVSRKYNESVRSKKSGSNNESANNEYSKDVNSTERHNISSNYYSNATKVSLNNVKVGSYNIIRKNIFKNKDTYEAYVLISNNSDYYSGSSDVALKLNNQIESSTKMLNEKSKIETDNKDT